MTPTVKAYEINLNIEKKVKEVKVKSPIFKKVGLQLFLPLSDKNNNHYILFSISIAKK